MHRAIIYVYRLQDKTLILKPSVVINASLCSHCPFRGSTSLCRLSSSAVLLHTQTCTEVNKVLFTRRATCSSGCTLALTPSPSGGGEDQADSMHQTCCRFSLLRHRTSQPALCSLGQLGQRVFLRTRSRPRGRHRERAGT